MTKNQLVQYLARETNLSQAQVQRFLDALAKVVTDSLKSDKKVAITGFGTFDVAVRKGRRVKSPVSGEWMNVPSMKIARFRAGTDLKKALRQQP